MTTADRANMIDPCSTIPIGIARPTDEGAAALADLYAPVRDGLNQAARMMDQELQSALACVNDLCGHVKYYRGKQIRPALVLLSADACGGVTQEHCVLAAVVEMVHLATLLHDDVLDQADDRRRRRTINHLHGNEAAVLLGDYFISHAYHLCSSLADPHAARAVAGATNTVCEGELMQVFHRDDARLSEAEYFKIIRSKTAALTGTCCALGAHYAAAPAETEAALESYGVSVGTAFQIVDDILDMDGDETRTGKTLGRDLAMGEATLPLIHALSNLPAIDAEQLRAVVNGRSAAPASQVRAWLDRCGSIDYAFGVARRYVEKGIAQLDVLAPAPARDSLIAMAEFVLRRRF